MRAQVEQSFQSLRQYVEKEDYKGWDPYDGLTSKFFQSTFLRKNAFARLAWIQLFKRNPINLRKPLGVPKAHNAKGLALFISGYCNLYNIEPQEEYLKRIKYLTQKLIDSRSPGYSGACWGYYFDWQARAFFQPKGTPTVVATTYATYALLDAWEILRDERLLSIARTSCDFILKDLNRTFDQTGDFCFSYSPLDHTQVFNASLLGSRLLSRVYGITREDHLKDAAKKSVSFCCRHQNADGSWAYGTLPFHQWIDNFHTGFNLECIHEYQTFTEDSSFHSNLQSGLTFYLHNFFMQDGRAKYYHNRVYPIDIHAPAQLLVTLSRLGVLKKHLHLVERTLGWTIRHMQDETGYFYYQMKKSWNSKIPYMRWAQAWMFNAITFYLSELKNEPTKN